MGIKNQLGSFFVAFILFVPTNAFAGSVDGETGFTLIAQVDCQPGTGECPEDEYEQTEGYKEEQIEDEEEPDCE
ncbi:MAG: hypothetical protein QGM50_10410 [Anaerolineae bacterium]|nr:hypothetical protein [Anaerolineae bacterium]